MVLISVSFEGDSTKGNKGPYQEQYDPRCNLQFAGELKPPDGDGDALEAIFVIITGGETTIFSERSFQMYSFRTQLPPCNGPNTVEEKRTDQVHGHSMKDGKEDKKKEIESVQFHLTVYFYSFRSKRILVCTKTWYLLAHFHHLIAIKNGFC